MGYSSEQIFQKFFLVPQKKVPRYKNPIVPRYIIYIINIYYRHRKHRIFGSVATGSEPQNWTIEFDSVSRCDIGFRRHDIPISRGF